MKGSTLTITVMSLLLLATVVFALTLMWGAWPRREPAGASSLPTLGSVPADHWRVLADKRVFFGHQSVGSNIIEGVRELAGEHSEIDLRIVETTDLDSVEGPGLFHGKIGRNTRPKSKFLAFRRTLEKSKKATVDIAMLKLCYIDIRWNSDVQETFEKYVSTMTDLQNSQKNTIYIHSTVPIESKNSSLKKTLKEAIKPLIGRPGVVDDNRRRQQYNQLIADTFGGTSIVFDIARYESTGPDGSVPYQRENGARIRLMDARYTDDGGHLNAQGRRRVAEQFLIQLAAAANQAQPAGRQ